MPFEFKLPPVGENIEQAEIGNLRVAVGDVIAPDQVVMEIETEKAVFDLPCPEGGKILALRVKSGDTVKVGDTLLTLEAAGAEKTNEERHEPPPAETSPAPPPADRQSQTPPAEPPPPASPQSPARQVDRPAPQPPAATATAKRESSGAAQPPATRESAESDGVPAPAGPATRRLARELGVDLYRVKGSGSGGRITSEDVQAYVHNVLTSLEVPAPAPAATDAPPLPDFQQFGPIERHPLSKLMRTAAVNLSLAWTQIPHVTQHELADVTELDSARKKYMQSRSGPEGGPKVTMTVLAMKAAVTALKAMPHFNASLDTVANELVIKRYYHIGVAVDTEHGLVVPVLRNVDQKSVVQLAAELTDLASRARARKLLPQDMQGGTFTITNLGGIGGTFFTPIVNYPEVAILGMSRTSWQQVVIDGKPEIRLMLPLSLSYDHRVVNGADAARFIVKLAGLLSAPFQLLSEV
jgi:pyruvate dehydrogenase E2 component (dihydrolipoamide acetyltransferase)